MKIEVAKDDLHYLRTAVHEEFVRLARTPAATSSEFRPVVARSLDVLRKFGIRLNRAIAQTRGRGCFMESFVEEDVR